MVTRPLARAVLAWRRLRERFATALNDLVVEGAVASVERPFDIHRSVEFRNASSIKIGSKCTLRKGVILNGRSRVSELGIVFGPETYIKENCYVDSYGGRIRMEGYGAIGQFCVLAGQGGLRIGKYVMLGAHCYVLTSNHVTASLEIPYMLQGDRHEGVVIEDNVWIGGGSIVLDGVTIGQNSVVGAGSIVSKDIPPNSMYVDRNPRLLKGALLRLVGE